MVNQVMTLNVSYHECLCTCTHTKTHTCIITCILRTTLLMQAMTEMVTILQLEITIMDEILVRIYHITHAHTHPSTAWIHVSQVTSSVYMYATYNFIDRQSSSNPMTKCQGDNIGGFRGVPWNPPLFYNATKSSILRMQQHTDTDSLPTRRSGSSLSGCQSSTIRDHL